MHMVIRGVGDTVPCSLVSCNHNFGCYKYVVLASISDVVTLHLCIRVEVMWI